MVKHYLSRRMTRGKPKLLTMMLKSQHMRRWHLNNPWCQPLLILNYAAVIIQKHLRGYVTRRKNKLRVSLHKRSKKNSVCNYQLDKYLARLDYYKISKKVRPYWIDDGYSSWCAVKIQSLWRKHICYQRFLRGRMMIYQIAALTIQSLWKIHQFRRQRRLSYSLNLGDNRNQSSAIDELAALVIQSCWRSFCSKRIFKYFSDLICIKLKGAPADLLRSIVPNESSFLDSASGTHVRFRLGGHTFPPSVYFKIYTHRPLCDVNSFAPRDYSKEKKPEKMKINSSISNTGFTKNAKIGKAMNMQMGIRVGAKYFGASVTTTVDTDKWYKREESNPWRPIASSIMNELVVPPWSRDSISHPVTRKVDPFHFSKLRRRADVEAEKRRRKREWMAKAYRIANRDEKSSEEVQGRLHSIVQAVGEADVVSSTRKSPLRGGRNRGFSPTRTEDKAPSGYGISRGSIRDRADIDAVRLDMSAGALDSRRTGHRNQVADAHSEKGNDENYGSGNGRHRNDGAKQEYYEDDQEDTTNEYYYYNNPERAGGKSRDHLGDDSEMLKWSMALDFDDYKTDWQCLGTSLPSDAHTALKMPGRTYDMGSY